MRPVDILEWTMGWPWPLIVVLGALMAWGIVRFMTWDEEGAEEGSSSTAAREDCQCMCDVQ